MIRTWQDRCEDFGDMHITTHQDVQNKMMEEIEELRAEVTKWKTLYKHACVKDEGMKLYAEIERLKQRIKELEK